MLSKELPVPCTVVMADINGLKEANDTLGHEAGDELIIGSAECLRNGFDGIDAIYRLGDDECEATAAVWQRLLFFAGRLMIVPRAPDSFPGEQRMVL